MTTPDSIVTSLEMSKKLEEAGWEQDKCQFAWYYSPQPAPEEYVICFGVHKDKCDGGSFAAPTAEDILRMLPVSFTEEHHCEDHAKGQGHSSWLTLTPDLGFKKWHVAYVPSRHILGNPSFSADTLANAAAKMWIYLKEQNLLPTSPRPA